MGTGLIYVAIVAAWAAYLVPLLLRRHEDGTTTQATDEVTPTHDGPGARVLARRSSAQGSPTAQASTDDRGASYDRAPSYDQGASYERASAHSQCLPDDERPSPMPIAPAGRHGPSPAVRRRRILLALVVLTLGTGVLCLLGRVSSWAIAIPTGAVVVFVSSSVRVARSERGARVAMARRQRVQATPGGSRADSSRGVEATVSPPPPIPSARPADSDWSAGRGASGRRTPTAQPADARADGAGATGANGADGAAVAAGSEVRAGGVPESRDDGLWDPVQVPLPTYVNKAKAARTVRTVDLRLPGTWTSGRLPEAELLVRRDESAMLLDESGSDPSATDAAATDSERGEPDERRRAVGD